MRLATSRSRLLVTSLELVTEESVHNISMFFGNVVCYARSELPSILPNLETLDLTSSDEVYTKTLGLIELIYA